MGEFKGRVTRVHRSGEEWSSGRIYCHHLDKEIGFAGSCYASTGVTMTLYGELVTDPKWGQQIKVTSGQVDLTFTAQGLIDYLTDENKFEHIGPVRARALVDEFGVDGFQKRAEDPSRHMDFAKINGVTAETAKGIHDHWQEAKTVNALMVAFRTYGLDHARAIQVVRALGGTAVLLLREDPYRLIDLAGVPFAEIDKVERAGGIDKRDVRRIAGVVLSVLTHHAKDGHTRMDHKALLTAARNYSAYMGLSVEKMQEAEKYRAGLSSGSPFQLLEYGAALTRLLKAEQDFYQWVVKSRSQPSQLAKRTHTASAVAPSELTAQQQQAFKLCLNSSVTWIYGLAGTGKSYSARMICDLYSAAGMSVMLMAPTGKAAKRLEESTGRVATTIHRGLACRPKVGGASGKLKFTFEGDPLEAQLIIVDEVSMVDSELMGHLIRRIDLTRTSVIFMGDVNQLVPVGAGQPAVDIHKFECCVPMVQLTEIVRQAGKLAHYCVDVLDNKVRETTDYENGWILRTSVQATDTYEHILGAFESKWTEEYDSFSDIQILTPQNRGPLGVNTLNIVLQRHFQLSRYGIHTDTPLDGHPQIMVGDKVIQTKNDYNLGIFNGDTGIVLEVVEDQFHTYKKGSICVDFGLIDPVWLLTSGGSSNTNQTKNLKLAYALTVHKAQGSEYPCVIAVVDRIHKHMLTRSWLYTAVTRAQESICILGQLSAAQTAARQIHSPIAKTQGPRQTYLSALLLEEDLANWSEEETKS